MSNDNSEFEELVSQFDTLVKTSQRLRGRELTSNKRKRTRIQRKLNDLAENVVWTYDDDFAACRDIGHAWEEKFSEWEDGIFTRYCTCPRCGSTRTDTYDGTGIQLSRNYGYSEGYLLCDLVDDEIKDMGGKVKRFWRTVNIRRAVNSSTR